MSYGFMCHDCYKNKEISIVACQDGNCSEIALKNLT